MENVRHRVGFIGAGHISEYHAQALNRVRGVELAGIYDVDSRRSEAFAKKFDTRAVPSIPAFAAQGVDVIHVLTPPETHAAVALAALDLGAHVLVEKPLATDVHDCVRIGAAARERGLRVCVDHSLLYDLQIRRSIEAARSGKIGRIVSVDILRSADYPPYEGGPLPPQYRTAGYPFRDLGVHQLYLMAAFLGEIQDVQADWASLGGDPNLTFDEWHADVRCRGGRGHVHISFNVRPIQNLIIVQGTRGVLRIEQMSMFSTHRGAMPLPKAAERVINAYAESIQTVTQVSGGAFAFLCKTLRQYDGVQRLVADFYRTLDEHLPVPVSVEEATPIVYWTERVAGAADADAAAQSRVRTRPEGEVPILVTGAAGALGSAIVQRLQTRKQPLRVFVRRRAADRMPEGLQVAIGDLGDPKAVDDAVRGARVVIHAGAATRGTSIEQRTSTVAGTRNIIDACLRHGVEHLIYISSLSVVDWAGGHRSEPITEHSPMEPRPALRGAYTQTKLEAEMLVRRAVQERGLRAVILRPGQIFGGALPLVNAAVAREVFGKRVVLGDGNLRLPLVYMDDVVDAVCSALERQPAGGEIVQLVDDELPTQNEILQLAFGARAKPLRIPRPLVFSLGWLSELALRPLRRTSPFSRYRLRSALARRTYVSRNAKRLLDWEPRVGVYAGIKAVLEPASPLEHPRPAYATTGG